LKRAQTGFASCLLHINLSLGLPALYKKELKDYSDIIVKKRLWEEVCEKLFPATWGGLTREQKTKISKI
jgi:hypothetical protein